MDGAPVSVRSALLVREAQRETLAVRDAVRALWRQGEPVPTPEMIVRHEALAQCITALEITFQELVDSLDLDASLAALPPSDPAP